MMVRSMLELITVDLVVMEVLAVLKIIAHLVRA